MKLVEDDQQALDEFAQLLHQAHPEAKVSDSFNEELSLAIENTSSLKRSFQQSPFMRVAAALLIMCMLGVPLAAFMGVLPFTDKRPPAISFIPVTDFDALNAEYPALAPEVDIVPPADEYVDDVVYKQRVAVLVAHNYWQILLSPLPDFIEQPLLSFIDDVLAVIVVNQ
ncbi:MAG: hypothetical protein ACI84O_001535 [Myxococcota bacterium]|jgi:hypothetical protein